MSVYRYYRAGLEIGRFAFSPQGVTCRLRDQQTLRWQGEQPYSPELFDSLLDLRLPDAVTAIAAGALPEGPYEPGMEVFAQVDGARKAGTIYAQMRGRNPLDFIVSEGGLVAALDNECFMVCVLVREGYEAMTPLQDFARADVSPPRFGKRLLGTFAVPMRDGVKLSTDIYLPAGASPDSRLPAVLMRTCYGKHSTRRLSLFVHHGYVFIAQDCRGREESEGKWQPMINEMEDSDDTLNWIVAQPWSDGSVGMIGTSYLGTVQWTAAASGNPHLKAIVSLVTGGLPVYDFPHQNGIMCSGSLAWVFAMSQRRYQPALMERDDWDEIMRMRPLTETPRRALGYDIPFWTEWMEHEYYDAYWEKANWLLYQHKINVPALYVSGWYDDVCACTMETWDMNRRQNRPHQKLIAGPWLHKANLSRDILSLQFGVDSVRYDLFFTYLRWFDRHLKGMENGIDSEPPVEYYTMGENRWKTSSNWPPETVSPTSLYLTPQDGGKLESSPPAIAQTLQYRFDPQNPAPVVVDASENEGKMPEDYRQMELRDDVLVFTSAPLQADLEVTGEPHMVLYASSSARDTDWVVRLTEVDGEGRSIRLCDAVVRARFRQSYVRPKLLVPGETERYDIPLTWISNRFRKGHRIRVQITSGAGNSTFPNHGTGNLTATDTQWVVATQTVSFGGECATKIVLPIMPAEEGRE